MKNKLLWCIPLLLIIMACMIFNYALPQPPPPPPIQKQHFIRSKVLIHSQENLNIMSTPQIIIGAVATNVLINLTAAAAGENGPPGTGKLYVVKSDHTTNLVTLQNYPTTTGGTTTAEHGLVLTNTGTTETFGGLTYAIFSVKALAGASPSTGNYLGQSNDSGGFGTWAYAQFDIAKPPQIVIGGPAVTVPMIYGNYIYGTATTDNTTLQIVKPDGSFLVSPTVRPVSGGSVTVNNLVITDTGTTQNFNSGIYPIYTIRALTGATLGTAYEFELAPSPDTESYALFDIVTGTPATPSAPINLTGTIVP